MSQHSMPFPEAQNRKGLIAASILHMIRMLGYDRYKCCQDNFSVKGKKPGSLVPLAIKVLIICLFHT